MLKNNQTIKKDSTMKNLQRLISILLATGAIISCSKKPNIEVKISGLENDTIIIQYVPLSKYLVENNLIMDTVIAGNGEFTYNNPTDEPIIFLMFPKQGEFTRLSGHGYRPRTNYLFALLKPEDHIVINGAFKKYYTQSSAKGSDFVEDYCRIRSKYIQDMSDAVKVELKIDSLSHEKGNKEKINELFKKRNAIYNKADKVHLKYIRNNWDKKLSAFLLARQPLDTLGKYYEKLEPDVKNGIFKNALDNRLNKFKKYEKVREAKKKLTKGEKAPDFSLETIKGNKFTLSSLDKKYIVLDFWGSWCGWCIKGFPKMKSYYKKYKDKVEFVGIACRDTKKEWKSSIKNHDLNWIQVFNDSESGPDVSVKYGVEGYPTKFILDEKQNIIAKFVGESEEFYNKLDEIMKNN